MAQDSSTDPTWDEGKSAKRTSDEIGRGKEKEQDTTFTERMQKSANMAINSFTIISGGASTASTATKDSRSQTEANRLGKTMGETSTQNRPRELIGQSVKAPSYNHTAEASFQDFQQGTGLPDVGRREQPHTRAFRDQEATDGDAVVQLLNEPPSEISILGVFTPADADDLLTPDERERLRTALFDQPRKEAPWATLLDPAHDLLPQLEDAQTAEMLFGATDTDTARQQWLDQWRDVLTSYTDEVWGDLGPLAGEAQAEVSNMLGDPGKAHNKDHQALDRLRLVLAHLRG